MGTCLSASAEPKREVYTTVTWLDAPECPQVLAIPGGLLFGSYGGFLTWAIPAFHLPFKRNYCLVFGVLLGLENVPAETFAVELREKLTFRPGVVVGWKNPQGAWVQFTFKFEYEQTSLPAGARIVKDDRTDKRNAYFYY